MSPGLKAPLTVPVTGIDAAVDSAMLTTPSPATLASKLIATAGGVTFTAYVCVSVAVEVLPAASVNVIFASTVLSASATKSLPLTPIEKPSLPSARVITAVL